VFAVHRNGAVLVDGFHSLVLQSGLCKFSFFLGHGNLLCTIFYIKRLSENQALGDLQPGQYELRVSAENVDDELHAERSSRRMEPPSILYLAKTDATSDRLAVADHFLMRNHTIPCRCHGSEFDPVQD
jgi:hypothetical protein